MRNDTRYPARKSVVHTTPRGRAEDLRQGTDPSAVKYSSNQPSRDTSQQSTSRLHERKLCTRVQHEACNTTLRVMIGNTDKETCEGECKTICILHQKRDQFRRNSRRRPPNDDPQTTTSKRRPPNDDVLLLLHTSKYRFTSWRSRTRYTSSRPQHSTPCTPRTTTPCSAAACSPPLPS